jgi:hypothetical protein
MRTLQIVTRRGWKARTIVCAMMASAVACGSSSPATATLEITTRDSASVTVLQLSHSLNEIAAGAVGARTLEADLLIGGAETGFAHLADIAAFEDGRFAVLDRMERTIVLYDDDGSVLARFGREGAGPGEYHDPWAIAQVDSHLLIWDADAGKAFTVLQPNGEVISTSPARIEGDWSRIPYRSPHLYLDWPYQMPPEDITRRLRGLRADTFVHQIQTDERLVRPDDGADSVRVHLVVYDLALHIVDTVATLPGPVPPAWRESAGQGAHSNFRQPLFAARAVWTAGDGWLAVGHGLRPVLEVTPLDERMRGVVVRWPSADRTINQDDRMALATWYMEEHILKHMAERGANRWVRMSRREREREIERWASDVFPFAERAPAVTAIYGAGRCLWLAGHNPHDYADGTALTWLVLDLLTPRIQVVRIPRRGARIREVSARDVFVSYSDELGIQYLERYPADALGCQAYDGRSIVEP